MGGIPINFPDFLLQALDNLISNTGYKYVDTFDDYEQTISSNFQLIASIPDDKTTYQIRIKNNSEKLVFLRIGEPKSQESTDKSTALTIQPNSTYIRDISGCDIYARIDGETTLQINILTEVLQSHQEEQMTIPLQLQPTVGVGDNYGEGIPFSMIMNHSYNWSSRIQEIVQSKNNLTGYRLIKLIGFQPEKEYNIKLTTSEFNGIDKSKDKPFRVFLIPNISILKTLGTILLSTSEYKYSTSGGIQLLRDGVGLAKENNKIASCEIGETDVFFRPKKDSMFIHIDALTTSGPDGCIITDYDPVNQIITIGGV